MLRKVFSCLVLVTLCSKLTKSITGSPSSKDTKAKSNFAARKIVVTGSHIEIRVVNGTEEMNRLKERVEVLQKSSKKNAAKLYVLNNRVKMLQKSSEKTAAKLRSLNTLNAAINSMKTKHENISSYVRLIEKLQNQVNRLMMATPENKFVFVFPKTATYSYVIHRNAITRPLAAVTVCFWMITADTTNTGTPFSYSKTPEHNELLIYNYKGFSLWINGEKRGGSVSANDGNWHHICGTWQSTGGSWALYKDGVKKEQGSGLKTGYQIQAGGVLVLGQEQDSEGGGFQSSQSFIGNMTSVNIWSRVLSSQEMFRMSISCALGMGDVMKWSDVKSHHRQNVEEMFFPTCP